MRRPKIHVSAVVDEHGAMAPVAWMKMNRRTLKTDLAGSVKTKLQQFADSPDYREIVWREGVIALLHDMNPMMMDWIVPEQSATIAAVANNGDSAEHHTTEEITAAGIAGVPIMVCPGTTEECAIDVARLYRVADHVSQKARRRMERVLRRYIRGMDRVARKEGKGNVDLRVRVHLTAKGPRLAFGLASEHPGTQL